MSLAEVGDILRQVLDVTTDIILSPAKRLYVGYLFTSALLALFVFVRLKPRGSFLNYIFNKKVWLSSSSQLDLQIVVFNGFVKILFIGQFLVYGLHLAFWVDEIFTRYLGGFPFVLSETQTIIGYTLALTVFGDFTVYVVHRMMHQVPWLWRFHSVHHSATTLTPFTQLRVHPVELIINNARSILVFGLLTGLFDAASNHQVEKMTFLGVNVFGFAFFAFGANLRHSHVRLKYWNPLEYIFVSPFQHQIHHSDDERHYDKNFGSKFAFWDWIFGTLLPSKSVTRVKFGLGDKTHQYDSLYSAIFKPFRPKRKDEVGSRINQANLNP